MQLEKLEKKIEAKFVALAASQRDEVTRDSGDFMACLLNSFPDIRIALAGACKDAVVWRRVAEQQEIEIQTLRDVMRVAAIDSLPKGM